MQGTGSSLVGLTGGKWHRKRCFRGVKVGLGWLGPRRTDSAAVGLAGSVPGFKKCSMWNPVSGLGAL